MNSPTKTRYFKFILFLSGFSLLASFFVIQYGLEPGLHIAFLSWSFYILCIPSAHGDIILGVPLRLIRHKPFFTQPLMWTSAFLLNAFSVTFTPDIYLSSIPTQLLYRIIERPYPCWIIFVISAVGTMYPVIIGNENFYAKLYFHTIIHHIIKLLGVFTFIYFAHQELVIILNTLS